MIYKYQVRRMIEKIEAAGGKVHRDTHVIVASNTVKFSTNNLPLDVRRRSDVQPGIVYIVPKEN